MIVTLTRAEQTMTLELRSQESLRRFLEEAQSEGWAVQSVMTPQTVLADLWRAREQSEEGSDGK